MNLDLLETFLVRFSQLGDRPDGHHRDRRQPLLAAPSRIVALDARMVLAPANAPRPPLAIQPYPNQYTAHFALKNGETVLVRAIQPEDVPLIMALHGRHSERTIRMRFFSLVKVLSHDSLSACATSTTIARWP